MINIKKFLGLEYYTSELDEFLAEFDKTHPRLAASQRKEIEKYKQIFAMRDQPVRPEPKKTFWDKF